MRRRSNRRSADRSGPLAPAAAAFGLLASIIGPDAAAQTPKPLTHVVVMEGVSFRPDVITIRSGDSVVWKNHDPFPHTATSASGGFDSGNVPAGQSWTYTPRTAGEFPYVCALHPTMKAVLRVK
jgi:plastocyanin